MAGWSRTDWKEWREAEEKQRLEDIDLHLLHICKLAEETKVPGGLKRYLGGGIDFMLPEEARPFSGTKKTKIPAKLRWEVFKRDGFTCKGCGAQDDLSADHISPESKGGKTTLENLQTLCRSCNSKKGARA